MYTIKKFIFKRQIQVCMIHEYVIHCINPQRWFHFIHKPSWITKRSEIVPKINKNLQDSNPRSTIYVSNIQTFNPLLPHHCSLVSLHKTNKLTFLIIKSSTKLTLYALWHHIHNPQLMFIPQPSIPSVFFTLTLKTLKMRGEKKLKSAIQLIIQISFFPLFFHW